MGFIFGVGSHQRVKQILPFMRVPIRLWVLDGFEIARGSISFGRYIWGIWSPKIPTQTTNSPLITEISYPKNHWNLMHLPRHIEGFFWMCLQRFFLGGDLQSPPVTWDRMILRVEKKNSAFTGLQFHCDHSPPPDGNSPETNGALGSGARNSQVLEVSVVKRYCWFRCCSFEDRIFLGLKILK